jgi:GNAT superfamily N-acetyltransferase
MRILATHIDWHEISALRQDFLAANHCQIRYHARYTRGWASTFLLSLNNGKAIGYGSIMGLEDLAARDTIFEFHLLATYQSHWEMAFQALAQASGAVYVECQTNTPLLYRCLQTFCAEVQTPVFLFGKYTDTNLPNPGCLFRPRSSDDHSIFEHHSEPLGDQVLIKGDKILATGGYLSHYNPPYVDLYMEVHPDHRQEGLGSFLIQELCRLCLSKKRIPAARCNFENEASRRTLLKAGLQQVGMMAQGKLKQGAQSLTTPPSFQSA